MIGEMAAGATSSRRRRRGAKEKEGCYGRLSSPGTEEGGRKIWDWLRNIFPGLAFPLLLSSETTLFSDYVWRSRADGP